MTSLQAAEYYHDRGMHPVPVQYRGKNPTPNGWPGMASLPKPDLSKYFNGAPTNVGVILGDNYGLTDVDLDSQEAIYAASVLLEETGMVFGRPSKRFSHHFYRCDPPVRSRRYIDPVEPNKGKACLVELRCQKSDGTVGLQTVVPPSIHESGEQIRFEKGCDKDPANIDASVLQASVARVAAAALLARHWPGEGSGRNAAFIALAGVLARSGWSADQAVALVRAIYRAIWRGHADMEAAKAEVLATYEKHTRGSETTGRPKLEELIDKRVVGAAFDWLGASRNNPARSGQAVVSDAWAEPIPFGSFNPDDISPQCFPAWLGEMVSAVALNTETPVALAGLLSLSVTGSCVSGKAEVWPEQGYREPLNLFTCPAMESGTRKTGAMTALSLPLIEWEREAAKLIAPERKRATSERRTLEVRIEKLRGKAADDLAAVMREIQELEARLPVIPVVPRIFTADCTQERLASLMFEQGGRMAIFSDEGGPFDLLAGRYSKGVPNLDLWLQGHAGSPVRVDRADATKPPIIIDRPCLTVGISPQPDVLASLRDKPEFRGRGLIARFLFGLPTSPLGYRNLLPNPIPAGVESQYRSKIHQLIEFQPEAPLRLSLTPGAYREWKDFQRAIELQFRDGGKLQNMKDWGSKLPGAAARIAGIFHLVLQGTGPGTDELIPASTMQMALDLAASLISHARCVFELMERDPNLESAKKLVAWIVSGGHSSFTVRECFRAHQERFKRMDAMLPVLTLLEQHGYIRRLAQVSTGGRRPSDLCEVHPALVGQVGGIA
jgi:hypothetical protein